MKRALSALSLVLLIGACSTGPDRSPSLAPRAAEAIDPRVPVPDTSGSLPASPALRQRLEALLAGAQAAQGRFEPAMAAAERLSAGAAAPQSESWIAAQQALSGAVAERYPVTRALADADELAAQAIAGGGGLVPADVAAVRALSGEIAAIDQRQAARIDAVQRRLGS